LAKGKIFVDYCQNKDAGTLQNAIKKGVVKENEIIELKDIIGEEKYRVTKDSNVYFHSGGVSLEDLAAAISIYKTVSKQ
jgi:ornithine cyclodeaminase/alanine dehydrogenase-like protein (mu-crystallin family)